MSRYITSHYVTIFMNMIGMLVYFRGSSASNEGPEKGVFDFFPKAAVRT